MDLEVQNFLPGGIFVKIYCNWTGHARAIRRSTPVQNLSQLVDALRSKYRYYKYIRTHAKRELFEILYLKVKYRYASRYVNPGFFYVAT